MIITGTTILVTGANRGIGQALVGEALSRGAAQVYAGTRVPLAHQDARVTPLALDVTSPAQIQHAAGTVGSLDILINNAGVQPADDLRDRATIEQSLAVNLFGTWRVIQEFLPALTRSRGVIVNNASVLALAPFPGLPAYSISKAALLSMTLSFRTMLAGQGVRVQAVLPGPVDTDMIRGIDVPKASPESVARAIFDAIETEDEEIFPDPLAQSVAEAWRNGAAKELERQAAAFARGLSATSHPGP